MSKVLDAPLSAPCRGGPNRTRIAFLSAVMNFDNTRASLLMRTLADAGYEVVAIMPKARVRRESHPRVKNIPLPEPRVHFWPHSKLRTLLTACWERARNMLALARLTLRQRPDLCFCHEPDSWLVGLFVKRRTGARLVVDIREVYTDRATAFPLFLRRVVEKGIRVAMGILARRSDCVVHVSSHRANHYALQCPRTEVIPHRCSSEEFAQVSPQRPASLRDKLVFVHAGALRPNYAARELLLAMEMVVRRRPDVLCLVVGGDAGPSRSYQNDLDRLIGAGHAVVLPHISQQEMIALLKGCDVGIALVLPIDAGHRLASPTKFFEYLHAGMPVVASDVPELRDVVANWGCAVLVNACDPAEIAAAILALAEDRPLRHRMASKALAAAASLDWEAERSKLVAMVAELLG